MASITKYPSKRARAGYQWMVRYRSPDGREHTKRGFRTKDEAQKWADINATSIHTGEWINPTAGRTPLADLGDTWLKMQTHLKPSTQALTTQIWKGTVRPHWGHHMIADIKPSDVQAWVADMNKSASWVRHCHNVLAQILDLAVKDRALRDNPARGVKLPRKTTSVKVFWTLEQLRLFARECGEREDLILLLGTSGLRWGEAIALRPCDLDPLRRRIQVVRNAAKAGNRIVVGTPKTHECRSVAVAGFVMDMLMARAEGLGREDLLWVSDSGGWLKSPGHRTWFDGALRRAQAVDESLQRVTPHGLRHVAAGLLVESGANVKAVQRQLGHASASMTLDTYAELFDDGLDAVASVLDEGFSGVVKTWSNSQNEGRFRRSDSS